MSPVRCGLAAAAAAAAARSRARSLSQPTPVIVCRASGAGALTDPVSMSPVSCADRRRVGRLRACTDGVRRVDREGGPSRSQAARSALWHGFGRGIERGRFRFHRL